MPDPPRQSAIRLARPYASEQEFVEGDFSWLGRPTVVLPNTPARSPGDLVRFELILSSGTPIFRAEGQVVGHHPAGSKMPGLELRITRMDAKSKAILDQMRQRRAASARTAPKAVAPRPAESIASSPVASSPIAPSSTAVAAAPAPDPIAKAEVARLAPEPAPLVQSDDPGKSPTGETSSDISERSGIHLSPVRARVTPPPNRDEILDRLRERARQLAAKGALPARKSKQTA